MAYGYNAPTHGSLTAIHRLHCGIHQFLVIRYRQYRGEDANGNKKYGETQIKFVGGTNKGHPGEHPDVTAKREGREETGLMWPARERMWDNGNEGHPKFFYYVELEECTGELRTVDMFDDDGDWLGAPYWIDASEACRTLFYSHQEFCRIVCAEFGFI